MEVRQLRYVVRLAETLHFGRAAQSEHIAQSAFSGQIARLERELGVRLFDRDSHRVSLTVAGAAFVEKAEQVLASLGEAAAEARAQRPDAEQVLRVGILAEAAGELTPMIFSIYQALRPDVRLEFTELSMVDQVDRLVSGDVDVALLRMPMDDERLHMRALFAEPRVAAVPRHHDLAGASTLSVDDLLDQPFAVAASGSPAGWSSYWTCDDRRGEPGRVAARVRSVGESLMAISCLEAVDTFPLTAGRLFHHPGVAYVALRDAAPSTVALATRNRDTRLHVLAIDEAVKRAVRDHLDVVPGATPAAGP